MYLTVLKYQTDITVKSTQRFIARQLLSFCLGNRHVGSSEETGVYFILIIIPILSALDSLLQSLINRNHGSGKRSHRVNDALVTTMRIDFQRSLTESHPS